jgi:hypothetical protein
VLPDQAAANQPVSVAIEADQREFQLYVGGVFDAPCGTALDHGVLVVGCARGAATLSFWLESTKVKCRRHQDGCQKNMKSI